MVHYLGDRGVRGVLDRDFGVDISWDTPLLEGYRYIFLRPGADVDRPRSLSIPHPRELLLDGRFDAVLVPGYAHPFCRQVVCTARGLGIGTIVRGEFSDVPRIPRRGWFKSILRDLYLRWFYRHVDAFCYVGIEARRHLERRNVAADRLFFSPHAVDDSRLEAQRCQFHRDACRAALGIGQDQLVLIFSGKLIPRKDPLLLLEAVARMPGSSAVSLVIMGDGELRGRIEAEGRRVLDNRLHMVGFVNQSQLGRYYRAADALVLPSGFETWGLVINEAMHFGLPVVASRQVGCVLDLVLEGKTGFSFEARDAAGLAAHLSRLVMDRPMAIRMGQQARDHISGYTTGKAAAGILEACHFAARRARVP